MQEILAQAFSKTESCKDKLVQFISENSSVIKWLAALLLIPYGFELFNFNLTIDDECWATMGHASLWIGEGRWVQYVLTKLLFPFVVIPVVPFVVALGTSIIATVSIFRTVGVVKDWQVILLSFLVISFPTLTFTFGFDSLKFGIGFAYLLLALALKLFLKGRRSLWASGLLVGLAISVYQSMAIAAVVLFSVSILIESVREQSENKAVFRKVITMLPVFILAIIVHVAGKKFFSLASGVAVNTYLQGFFNLPAFLNAPGQMTLDALTNAMKAYGLKDGLHLGSRIGLQIFLVVSGGLVISMLWRQPARWLLLLIGLSTFLLVPFALTLFYGGLGLPWRTHVELPFAWTGLLLLAMIFSSMLQNRGLYFLVCVLGIWSAFSFSVTLNRYAGSAYLALQSDRLFTAQLLLRINELRIEHPEVKYLATIGQHYYDGDTELRPKAWEGIGLSFYEHDGGSLVRAIAFMRTMEKMDLQPVPVETAVKISNLQGPFKSWPARESVFVFNDTIVARLGVYTADRIVELCAAGSAMKECERN